MIYKVLNILVYKRLPCEIIEVKVTENNFILTVSQFKNKNRIIFVQKFFLPHGHLKITREPLLTINRGVKMVAIV